MAYIEREDAKTGLQRRFTAAEAERTPINLRVPAMARELIDRAAAIEGKTRTEFMLDSACRHARDVLLDQRVSSARRRQVRRIRPAARRAAAAYRRAAPAAAQQGALGRIATRPAPAWRPPEPLRDDHDRAGFSCGVADLDDWLRDHARNSEGLSARTYVLCDGLAVVGYYCLATGSVPRIGLPSARLRRNAPTRFRC